MHQTLPWGSAQTRGTGFLGSLLQVLLGGSAQTRGTGFLGSLLQVLLGGLRANSGTSRAHLHTATGAAFPAPGRAPINRQSPQRASSRLERGALWRSLAQPCARNPRNVSVCRRGPAFSRRLHRKSNSFSFPMSRVRKSIGKMTDSLYRCFFDSNFRNLYIA